MDFTNPEVAAFAEAANSSAAHAFVRRLFVIPPFAHHPTCKCFDGHLLRIGNIALCLGCSCLASGIGVSTIVLAYSAANYWDELNRIGPWWIIATGVALYFPTLIQPFFQQKPFKIMSRLALGSAIPLLWFAAIVLLPWSIMGLFLRAVFVIAFWQCYRLSQQFRARWTPNPCQSCSGGVFPFCEGNRDRLLKSIDDFRSKAGPQDQPFIGLIEGLAGIGNSSATIEVVPLRDIL